MSTTPFLAASPGFMPVAFRIAAPSLLFSIDSAPALKVLLGFAVRAEKSAPEPTAVATAARPSARAASVRVRRPLLGAGGIAGAWPPATAGRSTPNLLRQRIFFLLS